MTKRQAIAYFGTQAALARILGIKPPSVAGWKAVPLAHQHYLQRITGGRLRADPHPAERRKASA